MYIYIYILLYIYINIYYSKYFIRITPNLIKANIYGKLRKEVIIK